jgi:hypothetical protein
VRHSWVDEDQVCVTCYKHLTDGQLALRVKFAVMGLTPRTVWTCDEGMCWIRLSKQLTPDILADTEAA